MQVRIFKAIGLDALATTEREINEWIDREDVDVGYTNTAVCQIGEESSERNQCLVITVWYEQELDGDATVLRNGVQVLSNPLVLTADVSSVLEIPGEWRLEISSAEAERGDIALRTRMLVRSTRGGASPDDDWETIASPTLVTRYGVEAVIEQGVRYPEDEAPTVWRVVLKPRRT